MKKILIVLVVAITAACTPRPESKKESIRFKRYSLDEIGFSVALPASYNSLNLRSFLESRLQANPLDSNAVDERIALMKENGLSIRVFTDTLDTDNIILVFYDKNLSEIELTRSTAGFASTILKESISNSDLLPNSHVSYNKSKLSIKSHFSHLKISGDVDGVEKSKLECFLISTKRKSLTLFSVNDKELNLQDYINSSTVN